MYLLSLKSKSLNDISSLTTTIFTCEPPLSYGHLVTSKEFTTKKLRCFIIKRFYSSIQL